MLTNKLFKALNDVCLARLQLNFNYSFFNHKNERDWQNIYNAKYASFYDLLDAADNDTWNDFDSEFSARMKIIEQLTIHAEKTYSSNISKYDFVKSIVNKFHLEPKFYHILIYSFSSLSHKERQSAWSQLIETLI